MRRLMTTTLALLLVGSTLMFRQSVTAQQRTSQYWAAEPFRLAWQRTEQSVAMGGSDHTWFWGPGPRSAALRERDGSSPGGSRLVQYYDKGRMEVPFQFAGAESTQQLTFGRLVAEMVSGNIELGPQRFESGAAARIPVVGDLDNPLAPTYASFAGALAPAAAATGARPSQAIDRAGALTGRADLAASYPETAYAAYDDALGHNIPRVFQAFMQRQGVVQTPQGQRAEQLIDPLQVIGHPLTEAYWANAVLNGQVQPVLVQLFERRVLTYNPSNPANAQVELGNAGLHYYQWRYAGAQPRAARTEQVVAHFESGAQSVSGGYWFSFDDRGNGGTSTATDRLISPGVDDSIQAERFDYNVTTAAEFSFAALAGNLGADGGPVDLRSVNAVGMWIRGTGGRMSLQLSSSTSDDAYKAEFSVPANWNYVEVPLSNFKQDSGARLVDQPQALALATRIAFRPVAKPSSGTLDVDNMVFVTGQSAPTTQPGLPQIDDFEDGDLVSIFNTQWFTYTDQDDGGGSVAELAVTSPGANNSRNALRFRGSFDKKWAKTAFLGMGVPLAGEGQTADLSEYRAVQLTIKTDGQPYRLQLSSKLITDDNQYGITLLGSSEWTTLTIPFSLLETTSAKDVLPLNLALSQVENIIITPLNQPKAFQMYIDDVKLLK